jgi:hypothetical protein
MHGLPLAEYQDSAATAIMDNNIEASSSSHLVAAPDEVSDTGRRVDASNVRHRTFTVFANLPYELQNMIWAIAACESRVVELHSYTKYFRQSGRKKTELRFLSRTLGPAILHTCSGARQAGLRLYERLCFRDHFTGSYINWAVDYIKLSPSWYPWPHTRDYLHLSEIHEKCRRLIIQKYDFEALSWNMRFKNVEEIVLLCAEAGYPPWLDSGRLALLSIDDASSQGISRRSVLDDVRELQFKILTQVDDLEEFSRSIIRGLARSRTVVYQSFTHYDVQNLVPAFRRFRYACKKLHNIRVMYALRGKEQGMTKEQKAERKRKEKVEAQKNYRLAHPEIPWHEHGFQGNCPCIECSAQGGQLSPVNSSIEANCPLPLFIDNTNERLSGAEGSALSTAVGPSL